MVKYLIMPMLAMVFAASVVCTGEQAQAAPASGCAQLDPALTWYGDNRERLQAIIDANSPCAGTWTGQHPPVAIFDWDNTVVKNDIGYGTNYWMLLNNKVLQPPDANWRSISKYMTTEAADALREACGTEVAPGSPLPTSTNTACADEILAVLSDETTSGATAFDGYDARRTLGDYEFSAALAAGHTEAEITEYAAAAKQQNLNAPEGTQATIGTQEVDGYIRVYPQIRNLISVLQSNGIDTWVVSASPEPIVKVWAPEVGIDDAHVVGVRSVYADDRMTPLMQPCGGTSDAITYVDGKRCWANQAIFGITGPAAWQQAPADVRQIFGAGDSTTDVTFVSDATKGHLVIDRDKTELMCQAYDNHDGNWVVNPMFIDPLPQQDTPFPCSTAGYTQPDGSETPLHRPDGSIVPDQADAVHP